MKRASSFETSEMHVSVRLRHLSSVERQIPGCTVAVECGDNFVAVKQYDAEAIYSFDSVFSPSETNHDIYERVVHPIALSCLSGYNGAILAYGQTASGKTYTMQGTRAPDDPGIIDLAALHFFLSILKRFAFRSATLKFSKKKFVIYYPMTC